SASVIPHVGAMATLLTQAEGVDVRRGADLEDEYQLVLGPVEASHAAVGLVPHAEVLQLREHLLAAGQELAHVAQVHAHEGDRAVTTRLGRVAQRRGEKSGERPLAHLPGGERKLTMVDLAIAAD